MRSPVLVDAVEAAVIRLMTDRMPMADAVQFEAVKANWLQTAADHEAWLTVDLLDAAVDWLLYRDPDRRGMPPVGAFLEHCRRFKQEADARAATVAVLDHVHRPRLTNVEVAPSPPGCPPGPPALSWKVMTQAQRRAYFRWHVAVGKVRIRKRFALINAYRTQQGQPPNTGVPPEVWKGRDDPTTEEVAAMLREMGEDWTPPEPLAAAVHGIWPR